MGAKHVLGTALVAWVVSGCGTAEVETQNTLSLEKAESGLMVQNGINPNGRLLNGVLLSVRYDGARRQGMNTSLSELWLEGTVFHGLQGSEELSGQDFQLVTFVGDVDNGTTVPVRIDSITQGTGADQDVWSYRVMYQEPTDGRWYSICRAEDGTPLNAIPLEHRWDYRQGVAGGGSKIHDATRFTFACEEAALAKCVRNGYKPWSSLNGVSLEEHHQACTRLLRADFCGDGSSYTVNGNWVNLYDSVSVQADTASWAAEAEWTAAGASCFTAQTRATEPIQCADGRLVPTCGSSFSAGTLLISEIPTQP
jgi:hypothetical protein